MMIREVWTLNTIPSPFDPPSLFVFPWPILEASSHFYFGSCFGFTLITLAWIAKSSLFGFGQKYLESDWLLMIYLCLSLAQWNSHKLTTLKAFWRGDLNNKSPFWMCFLAAVWFSLISSGVKSWKSVKIEYSVAVLLTVPQLAKQMNHGPICLASLRSSDNI